MGSVNPATTALANVQWRQQVIQPGDTLGEYATEHDTSVGRIAHRNDIADPNHIVAGESIYLPHVDTGGFAAEIEPAPPTTEPPTPGELPPTGGHIAIEDGGLTPTPVPVPVPPTPADRGPIRVAVDPAPVDTRDASEIGTPASGFVGGLASMGRSIGSTVTDTATFVGVDTNDDGSLKAGVDPLALGGFGLATAGPTALMALRDPVNPLTGQSTPYLERLGTTAASNSIRITPTLVSAVLGPAIADGVTMIAPNLVKKYQDTKDIKLAAEKKEAEKNNQEAKISRAVAGGVVVGLAAGAVFLLKPEVFKKFGAGVTHAIEGSTQFAIDGKVGKLTGVLDASQIRSLTGAADTAAVNILKTVSPMAKDAVFTNRTLVAAAGGVGTLLLADRAAGEEDPERRKLMLGLTAAAGLATVGGAYGIGKLTQHGITAQSGVGGVLAKNDLLWKPNVEWIKKYATTIAPITAVPAGTAASQYFNIVNDFDEITGSRSPFRK